MKTDINDIGDIKALVDNFYQQAGKDELLGPIFSQLVHSERDKQSLYHYWNYALLNAQDGGQQPFPRHIELMFTRRHFIRWLNLFIETIDVLYSGERAEKAKIMVIRKSEEFQSKLELSRF